MTTSSGSALREYCQRVASPVLGPLSPQDQGFSRGGHLPTNPTQELCWFSRIVVCVNSPRDFPIGAYRRLTRSVSRPSASESGRP